MLTAKNSNDCSTQRCTTHQRQKSVMVNDFPTPVSGIMPNTYNTAMLIVAAQIRFSRRMRPDQNWRVASHSMALVGHRARKMSALQMMSPMKNAICQNRPSSMYDRPWIPTQNQPDSMYPFIPTPLPISPPPPTPIRPHDKM